MKFSLLVATVVTVFAVHGNVASAATFNQNRIIDDEIFDNSGTMNASQIDSFLNQFPNSCISPNSGFRAIDPIGYNPSSGYQYGGVVTAGQVIYDSSHVYGINPQVILTTLQKEQSLVAGGTNFCNNGDQNKYTAAVGYGCPDGGVVYNYSGLNLYQRNGVTVSSTGPTCVNSASKAGFSQQVIRAAWLLKFGQQRAKGNISWAVITGSWDNSDDPQSCYGGPMTQGTWQRCPSGSTAFFDGYTTIDGVAVHMDSGATAALYWYTPHFHGNQSFFDIFTNWFGPTTTSGFTWQPVSQGVYTDSSKTTPQDPNSLIVGQRYYVTVSAKNVGSQTWTKNVANVGTDIPLDRASSMYDTTWPSWNRAGTLDQNTVAPGETGSFSFWIKPSKSGSFKEYFNFVADGYSWFNDLGLYFPLTVSARNYSWQYQGQGVYTDQTKATSAELTQAVPGQRYFITVQLKNTGNIIWRKNYVNLATSGPQNRRSAVADSTWPAPDRAATLDQATVAPGETGSFSFWIKAPLAKGGTLNEYFSPVEDGLGWFPDYGMFWHIVSPAPQYSWQYQGQGVYTDASATTPADITNLSPNTRYYIKTLLKNTGNVIWYPGYVNLATSNQINRSSAFYDSTWMSPTRPATVADTTVQPGQSTSFGFWIKTPATSGSYNEYFSPVADGITWFIDYGMYWNLHVH